LINAPAKSSVEAVITDMDKNAVSIEKDSVKFSKEGTYTITYTVKDVAGKELCKRLCAVIVKPNISPDIEVINIYTGVTVESGQELYVPTAIVTDNVDKKLNASYEIYYSDGRKIKTENDKFTPNVDYYDKIYVNYSATDRAGNSSKTSIEIGVLGKGYGFNFSEELDKLTAPDSPALKLFTALSFNTDKKYTKDSSLGSIKSKITRKGSPVGYAVYMYPGKVFPTSDITKYKSIDIWIYNANKYVIQSKLTIVSNEKDWIQHFGEPVDVAPGTWRKLTVNIEELIISGEDLTNIYLVYVDVLNKQINSKDINATVYLDNLMLTPNPKIPKKGNKPKPILPSDIGYKFDKPGEMYNLEMPNSPPLGIKTIYTFNADKAYTRDKSAGSIKALLTRNTSSLSYAAYLVPKKTFPTADISKYNGLEIWVYNANNFIIETRMAVVTDAVSWTQFFGEKIRITPKSWGRVWISLEKLKKQNVRLSNIAQAYVDVNNLTKDATSINATIYMDNLSFKIIEEDDVPVTPGETINNTGWYFETAAELQMIDAPVNDALGIKTNFVFNADKKYTINNSNGSVKATVTRTNSAMGYLAYFYPGRAFPSADISKYSGLEMYVYNANSFKTGARLAIVADEKTWTQYFGDEITIEPYSWGKVFIRIDDLLIDGVNMSNISMAYVDVLDLTPDATTINGVYYMDNLLFGTTLKSSLTKNGSFFDLEAELRKLEAPTNVALSMSTIYNFNTDKTFTFDNSIGSVKAQIKRTTTIRTYAAYLYPNKTFPSADISKYNVLEISIFNPNSYDLGSRLGLVTDGIAWTQYFSGSVVIKPNTWSKLSLDLAALKANNVKLNNIAMAYVEVDNLQPGSQSIDTTVYLDNLYFK
jgi:hypothetical protein